MLTAMLKPRKVFHARVPLAGKVTLSFRRRSTADFRNISAATVCTILHVYSIGWGLIRPLDLARSSGQPEA